MEKPYSFTEMIGVLKETMKGARVTQFLPRSSDEMLEKLELPMGELFAGHTAVFSQIMALLTRWHLV